MSARAGRRSRRRLAGDVRAGDRRRRHPRRHELRAAHALLPAARAGPSRTRASGSAPSPRRWPRCAARSAAGRCGRSRSARSSTGWCRPAADGEPAGPALIWMDRRAGAECDAAAEPASIPRACASSPAATSTPATSRAKIAWLAAHRPSSTPPRAGSCCPARSSPGGPRARWPSIRPTPRRRCCSTSRPAAGRRRRAPRSGSIPARWRRCARPTPCSARSRRGCATPPASTPRRWSCSAAATRWRRRSAPAWSTPGAVCDVMGTAEPVCAVAPGPALDPEGVTELHPHADPGGWLLENPGWLSGGAYRWFRDELGSVEAARAAATGADVYELLNDLAAGVPAGADGVLWVPALAGAMAPGVERRRPRRLVRPHRRPRPRAHGPRPARGQRLRAARRARGDGRGRPRPDRARLRRGRREGRPAAPDPGRRDRPAGHPARRRRDDRARRRDAGRVGRRACMPTRRRAATRDGRPAGRAGCSPTPSGASSTTRLHARHRALYSALRPLFS